MVVIPLDLCFLPNQLSTYELTVDIRAPAGEAVYQSSGSAQEQLGVMVLLAADPTKDPLGRARSFGCQVKDDGFVA